MAKYRAAQTKTADRVSAVPYLAKRGSEVFLCPVHCLQTVGRVELLEDVVDVRLDGVRAQAQGLGDLRVLGAGGQHLEYLDLAIGQGHFAAGKGLDRKSTRLNSSHVKI